MLDPYLAWKSEAEFEDQERTFLESKIASWVTVTAPFALESDGMNRKIVDHPVLGWALVEEELSCYLGLQSCWVVGEAAEFLRFLLSSR